MRIIDGHMHLLGITGHDWYPGLKQMADTYSLPHLYQDFLLDDYRAAAGPALAVDGFVHVSATTKPRAYLDEAAWVEAIADEHDLAMVLIGTVDPGLSAEEITADLEQQARSPRFRGVRVLYDFAPDSDAAAVVLPWLEERGHVFDLVIQPAQMDGWLKRLEAHPDLAVVLEHTGWPAGTEQADRDQWAGALRDFASATDAPCKLSGLGMTTGDLSEATLRPWLEHALETFGWDRVIFGSNMPIETMAGSYADYVATLEAVTTGASAEERQRFWADNAVRAYRI